jgi:hypothetical protein
MLFKLHRLHLILQRMTPYWCALINTINKVVYTLNEPETNCAKSTSDLNSAILGLTDKCLGFSLLRRSYSEIHLVVVPLTCQRNEKCQAAFFIFKEIALREPL